MDKRFPLLQPYFPVAEAPERLTNADMVEVRVTLTPMEWHEAYKNYQPKERGQVLGTQTLIARVEARDHRALFHITWRMLEEMFRYYMGLEMKP